MQPDYKALGNYNYVYTTLYISNTSSANTLIDGAVLDSTINAYELPGAQYIHTIVIVNCSFIKNIGKSNGAVYVLSVPLRFNITTTFIANTGIKSVLSLLHLLLSDSVNTVMLLIKVTQATKEELYTCLVNLKSVFLITAHFTLQH